MNQLIIIKIDTSGSRLVREHIVMPSNISTIYKKFIKKNPDCWLNVDDGFEFHYRDLHVEIIDDEKMIEAFELLNCHIETSTFNICEQILKTMIDTIVPNRKRKHCYSKAEQQIVDLVEERDFYLDRSGSILTQNDYKYIILHKTMLEKYSYS